MRVAALSAALAAAALATPLASQQIADAELVVRRFFRVGGTTLVDVFFKVPFDWLQPMEVGRPGAGDAGFRVDVAVRDSDGMVLHESDWSRQVSAHALALSRASTMEHFAFAASPGRYTVLVAVTDSASGARRERSVDVDAWSAVPLMSDLLATSSMRRAPESDVAAQPAPGEIRKGSLLLGVSAEPVLTPRSAQLYYYVELYPDAPGVVQLSARVLGEDGAAVVESAPEQLSVTPDGGIVARALDLSGIPVGQYELELAAAFPDTRVVRTAGFAVSGFGTESGIEAATNASQGDWAADLTEVQLDSLWWPLVYLAEASERGVYDGLSLEGKRNFLRDFWRRRDPTPETVENEAQVAYYQAVGAATRRFRESGAGDVPGWRTDRGRIFLKQGEPEEVLRRPQAGATMPFEVWKFSRPRDLKYIFFDQTGLGNYVLIYTNDRFETGRPDWEALLGREAAEEALRF